MSWRSYCVFLLAFGLTGLAPQAFGANPVTWNIDIFTTGDDVFWTSPTPVTLDFPEYDWSYEVTKLSAEVAILGEQDLLGQLGDAASGAGTTSTLPIVLFDEFIEEELTGSSANLRIEVDENGFGQTSATDIVLGRLGLFSIERVDLEATVTIVGIAPGDYNRDGAVDDLDYAVWKADFGSTTDLAADGNGNNVVDAADYTLWRDNLVVEVAPAAGSHAAVPEPATLALLPALFALVASRSVRFR